jgi:hypothetical protein
MASLLDDDPEAKVFELYRMVRKSIVSSADPCWEAELVTSWTDDFLLDACLHHEGCKMLLAALRNAPDHGWARLFSVVAQTSTTLLKLCKHEHGHQVITTLVSGLREDDLLHAFAVGAIGDLSDCRFGRRCLEAAVEALGEPLQCDLARRLLPAYESGCHFTRQWLQFLAAGRAEGAEEPLRQLWPAAPGKELRIRLLRAMSRTFPLFSVDPAVKRQLEDDRRFALRALRACAPAMHEACVCDLARPNLFRALGRICDVNLSRFLKNHPYALRILQLDGRSDWPTCPALQGKRQTLQRLCAPLDELARRSWPTAFLPMGVDRIFSFVRLSEQNASHVVRMFSSYTTIRKLACDAVASNVVRYLIDRSLSFRKRVFEAFDVRSGAADTADNCSLQMSIDLLSNENGARTFMRVMRRWSFLHAGDGPFRFARDHVEHLARRPVAADVVSAVFLYAPVFKLDLMIDITEKLAEMEARAERVYVSEGVKLVSGLNRDARR